MCFRSQFVADNLLFYTILFQEFLPRVFRMDLCAAKNAYMLFRVSKVLNLTYLRNMIEEGVYNPGVHSIEHTVPMRGKGSQKPL